MKYVKKGTDRSNTLRKINKKKEITTLAIMLLLFTLTACTGSRSAEENQAVLNGNTNMGVLQDEVSELKGSVQDLEIAVIDIENQLDGKGPQSGLATKEYVDSGDSDLEAGLNELNNQITITNVAVRELEVIVKGISGVSKGYVDQKDQVLTDRTNYLYAGLSDTSHNVEQLADKVDDLETRVDELDPSGGNNEWISVTFRHGWENVGAYGISDVAYYKDRFGRVHFRGGIKGGVTEAVSFELPQGYRPDGGVRVFSVVNNSVECRVNINPFAGHVFVGKCDNSYISLDGISFRAQ